MANRNCPPVLKTDSLEDLYDETVQKTTTMQLADAFIDEGDNVTSTSVESKKLAKTTNVGDEGSLVLESANLNQSFLNIAEFCNSSVTTSPDSLTSVFPPAVQENQGCSEEFSLPAMPSNPLEKFSLPKILSDSAATSSTEASGKNRDVTWDNSTKTASLGIAKFQWYKNKFSDVVTTTKQNKEDAERRLQQYMDNLADMYEEDRTPPPVSKPSSKETEEELIFPMEDID